MLKIHTRDGQTCRVDLKDEIQAKKLMRSLDSHDFQKSISGLTILETQPVKVRCPHCKLKLTRDVGTQVTLSRPMVEGVRFEPFLINHASGGTGVDLFVSDLRLTLTSRERHRASTIDIERVGRRLSVPKLYRG